MVRILNCTDFEESLEYIICELLSFYLSLKKTLEVFQSKFFRFSQYIMACQKLTLTYIDQGKNSFMILKFTI